MRNKKYIYYSQLSFLIVLIIFFGINGLKILIILMYTMKQKIELLIK